MELLTIQHIGEAAPRRIITACEDTDTCPSCGAGYRVGLSECEYCRVPVRGNGPKQYSRVSWDEYGNASMCSVEAIAPPLLDERFRI